MTDKQTQFIMELQTATLLHYFRKDLQRLRDNEPFELEKVGIMRGILGLDFIFSASVQIPEEKTAHEAAFEWLEFLITENTETIPSWYDPYFEYEVKSGTTRSQMLNSREPKQPLSPPETDDVA